PWHGDPDASGFDEEYTPTIEANDPGADAPHEEGAPPPPAEGEASEADDERGRRGRRRRGRGRGRGSSGRSSSREPGSEAPASGPGAPGEAGPTPPPHQDELRPLDDERPRLMDSAERRTEEGDEAHEPLEPK